MEIKAFDIDVVEGNGCGDIKAALLNFGWTHVEVFPHTCRLTKDRAREMLQIVSRGIGLKNSEEILSEWEEKGFIIPEPTALEKAREKYEYIKESWPCESAKKEVQEIVDLYEQYFKRTGYDEAKI